MATLAKPAYLLEHHWDEEPRCLELLEAHADPTTKRRIEAAGLAEG